MALLLSLNPRTLTMLASQGAETFEAHGIYPGYWMSIGESWSKLEVVRFVGCTWRCRSVFFSGFASSSIAFSWTFPLKLGGYKALPPGSVEDVSHRLLDVFFVRVGVFKHPAVVAKGIELVIEDNPEERERVTGDLETHPDSLRSMVRLITL
jgi:hypothetical protein